MRCTASDSARQIFVLPSPWDEPLGHPPLPYLPYKPTPQILAVESWGSNGTAVWPKPANTSSALTTPEPTAACADLGSAAGIAICKNPLNTENLG